MRLSPVIAPVCLAVIVAIGGVQSAPASDLVTSVPGFGPFPFKMYSGYLTVAGPLGGAEEYDTIVIHYELHTSQRSPSTDPILTWHQGGPGGSSMYGAYAEMGYFQTDSNGTHTNPWAWNRVANMLYLESPAGCDDPIGFSYCTKDGRTLPSCSWTDQTQAEAYAHTLATFFQQFPEFKSNDLYMTGESYAGQYVPNIAHFIVTNEPFKSTINLKGLALGNACWGGDASHVNCNGPNSDQNDIDMYYGKGLVAKKTYEHVYKVCKFPNVGLLCDAALEQAFREVGPHNVYDIYDNCPQTEAWLRNTNQSMRALLKYARARMVPGADHEALQATLGGGYEWSCDGMGAMERFFKRSDVQAALHLKKPGQSRFGYRQTGPASITLWPALAKALRVLIYNGDSDACVPYKGNEEWTTGLADAGTLKEQRAWHPWFTPQTPNMPAGYATTYNVTGSTKDFSFVTVRLAGHMVPQYQPVSAFVFIDKFLKRQPF